MPSPNNKPPSLKYGDPIEHPDPAPRFRPLPKRPAPNGAEAGAELAIALDAVSPGAETRVTKSGVLVFHAVGDTGNDNGDKVQIAIAEAMDKQVEAAEKDLKPAFLYILGDVVYSRGAPDRYDERFYKPYREYAPPIVSIPGNHDASGSSTAPADSHDGWIQNFMGTLPKSDWDKYRPPQNFPYPYWELQTSVTRIIGLDSNFDGTLDDAGGVTPQADWLAARLGAAPADLPVLIFVHHPPYSLAKSHGGSPSIGNAIDVAAAKAGRWPDAVFSGHVHSYQRFTRRLRNAAADAVEREIPYIVSGCGGRAESRSKIDQLRKWDGKPDIKPPFHTKPRAGSLDVDLVAMDMHDPGFLTLEVRRKSLTCTYWQVPFENDRPVEWQDRFTLDFKTHKISNQ
jgi:hypothetical protein